MSSAAYTIFRTRLIPDVDELILIHKDSRTGRRGRHHLGHLTRSALMLSCTALEQYIELVCQSLINKVIENAAFQKTDLCLQKAFALYIKENKNDLFCLQLMEDGWRDCLKKYVSDKVSLFNTPNTQNIKKLIKETTGMDVSPIFTASRSNMLNKFIKERGDITHQGANTHYPTINNVVLYRNSMCDLVMDIDEFMAIEAKKVLGKQAWCRLPNSVRILPVTP